MVSAKLKRQLQSQKHTLKANTHNGYLYNGAVLEQVESLGGAEIIKPKAEPGASEQITKQLWNFLSENNHVLTENVEKFLEEQNDTNTKWSVVTESSSLPNSILLTNDNTMTMHNLPRRRHHYNNNNNNNNVKLLRNKIMDNSNSNTNGSTDWLTVMSTPASNMDSLSSSLSTQLLLTEVAHESTVTASSATSVTAASATASAAATATTLATDTAAFSIFPATTNNFMLNDTAAAAIWNLENTSEEEFDFFYRHSFWMSTLLIFAYIVVFVVGLVGNSFVIAVVLRAPRMRTVTNYFIVNLAVADILVIVFCLPATLMSNIFLRKCTSNYLCK